MELVDWGIPFNYLLIYLWEKKMESNPETFSHLSPTVYTRQPCPLKEALKCSKHRNYRYNLLKLLLQNTQRQPGTTYIEFTYWWTNFEKKIVA